MAATWQWLLESQHPDGSWGTSGGLAEETSYVVLALHALEPHFGPAPAGVYQRAHTYLCPHLNTPDPPALWIVKTLYTPVNIVRAALLSACTLTEMRCTTKKTAAR